MKSSLIATFINQDKRQLQQSVSTAQIALTVESKGGKSKSSKEFWEVWLIFYGQNHRWLDGHFANVTGIPLSFILVRAICEHLATFPFSSKSNNSDDVQLQHLPKRANPPIFSRLSSFTHFAFGN